MKKWKSIFIAAMSALLPAAFALNAEQLAEQFAAPPDEYRPWVFWEWCDGNINRTGVTSDLEAMKRAGLGGGKIFNVTRCPEGPVRFSSKEWFDLVAFSCQEAGRLGLELGLNITEGFNAAGGPWIAPEKSMQHVIWSETEVSGPGKVKIRLPKPDPILSKKLTDFYDDIKVFAVPAVGDSRIKDIDQKSAVPPHHPNTKSIAKATAASAIHAGDIIQSAQVIEISGHMNKDGILEWQVPDGKWTVLRMGRASTGSSTRPANPKTQGLECDKLSRETVKLHFDSLCLPLLGMKGVRPGTTLKFLGIDSWEAKAQNWSPVLPAEFEKRRGYSLYPYLPVLTGRVVDSVEISERFLWDFRRTIADCIHDNFFVYLQELCEQYGVNFEAESFTRATFDGSEVSEAIGLPTSTFWQKPDQLENKGQLYRQARWASSAAHVSGAKVVGAEAFTANKDRSGWSNHPYLLKSLGDHAYCNGVNRFLFHCYPLQPWAEKVRAVHKPGMTFSWWGIQYSQHNTWWNQGLAWQQYQTRCNFLLQRGLFAADVIYLAGEEAPGHDMDISAEVTLPFGYNWDMCSARAILEKMSVQDGEIRLQSGMKYRLLVLPPMDGITLPLLTKVTELIQNGAHVLVQSRPARSRGLSGYPDCDAQVKHMTAALWQNLDGKRVKEQRFGAGKIYWGIQEEEILTKLGVAPDFTVQAEKPDGEYPVNLIHRYSDTEDIYFVSSFMEKPSSALCGFRVIGKQPELWYPDTGKTEPCAVFEQRDGRTYVPLRFDSYGSVFVVFRAAASAPPVTRVEHGTIPVVSTVSQKEIMPEAPVRLWTGADGLLFAEFLQAGSYRLTFADGKTLEQNVTKPGEKMLDSDWTVSFPAGSDAPASILFKQLIPWNEHENEDIRHFSGTAVYSRSVELDAIDPAVRILLDLGAVQVIAEVLVNGEEQGILWKPPFRVDVTDALKAGSNRIEVRVTNLWVNRMIRDEQFPLDFKRDKNGFVEEWPDWLLKDTVRPEQRRKTFSLYQHYKGDEPLLPSGLIGPVRLLAAERVSLPLP